MNKKSISIALEKIKKIIPINTNEFCSEIINDDNIIIKMNKGNECEVILKAKDEKGIIYMYYFFWIGFINTILGGDIYGNFEISRN